MHVIITGEAIDYNTGIHINVTFPVGSTNASYDIIINNDNVLEGNNKLNISIGSITNDHIVGTPGVATVTIIDTTSKYTNFKFLLLNLISRYMHT